MKKFFSILSLILCVSLLLPLSFSNAQAMNSEEGYKSNIVYALDIEGKKLSSLSKHNQVHTNINDFNINQNSVDIVGTITNSGSEIPFELTGSLYRSCNSNGGVIGELTDKTGNYNVVHFSINSDPQTTFFFNENLKQAKGNVVKLYLIDANRNFIYIELEDPDFLNGSMFRENFNVDYLEQADTIEELWYAKIIKPIKKTVEGSPDILPLSMRTSSYIKTYTYVYDVIGVAITETFKVKHYLSAPDSIIDQGQWYAQLSVYSEGTKGSEPGFDSSDTNFHIGWYDNTYIRAYTDTGDAFDSTEWGATCLQSGGLDINISWNTYSKSYGPLSFTATYNDSENVSLGETKVFSNDTELTRQVQTSLSTDYELCDPGHEFHSIFNIGHYNTSSTKNASARFIYDIANGLDYAYGGNQTNTRTLSYTSGY